MLQIKPNGIKTQNHNKTKRLLEAFTKGCESRIYSWDERSKAGKDLVIYGILYGQEKVFPLCENYWYIDNGYFKPSVPRESFNGYYRVVRNGLFYNGPNNEFMPEDRFEKINDIKFSDLPNWRKPNRDQKIILIPPTNNQIRGFPSLKKWEGKVRARLHGKTKRKIEVSTKKNPLSKRKSWDDIWCLITYSSNIQTEALMRGTPVITTHFNCLGSLDGIEDPPLDRRILLNYAYNQWKIEDIENGKAWEELNK